MGVRLRWMGTPLLNWQDVWLIAANAPAGSRLAAALDPMLAWDHTDWWLRSIDHTLRWLAWSRTKDAAHGRNRPKPVDPPGNPQPRVQPDTGTTVMSRTQLDAYLRLPRVAAPTPP